MATDHRALLKNITTFPSLVKYLRDELDWPLDQADFEDLTYDYTPEELGIDGANAAKIEGIKRLKPLTAKQPWGIFFVKFEPKRLPVVALRRILNRVVRKKRASTDRAERVAWEMEDLLFVSNYGEDDQRQISLAHFSLDGKKGGLPALKVLGWDNLNTPLHLDRVAEELHGKLTWPEDEDDVENWRETWGSAFTLGHREVITTSKRLAERLAVLARAIRDRIETVLEIETDDGPLTKLMDAFREALVHDLDASRFADMYAQTIAYGLLSARITDPHPDSGSGFAGQLPVTNPFLKELMETFLDVGGGTGSSGVDFDELGVNDVVEVLNAAKMEAVLVDFGDENPQEDPVIHFYELFLKEYDARQKMQRGVFYTPRPVVSYIVRSVDDLLRTEFDLEDGLADTTSWAEMAKRHKDLDIPEGVSADQAFVQILDPATGTGTFLVEVIDLVHKTMVEKWKGQGHGSQKAEQLWNDYVAEHLLPRLHGYELLMAPYAIAHLKVGLKLYETGYRFSSDERARVFLTNALEPANEAQLTLDFLPALAHEAQAVNNIKRNQRFTVVIGNPPYSGLSSNMGPWIDGLLKGRLPDGTQTESYYHADGEPLGEKKLWLQDDYVKFTRVSQWLLDNSGCGIHGYITNHSYLDNPTFRGMRWSLMSSFRDISVLDLHGNLKKKEVAPDGCKDVNVFDIQQGVALGLFVKKVGADTAIEPNSIRHSEMWGDRQSKYDRLLAKTIGSTDCQEVSADAPFFLFKPFDGSDLGDYCDWRAINEVMPVNVTGIVTARDHFVIDFDCDSLLERIAVLRDTTISDDAIRQSFFSGKGSKKYPPGDSRGWKLPEARERVRTDSRWNDRCAPILYRPFDDRQIYYVPWMVDWPRSEAMPHMLAGENQALLVGRAGHVIGPGEWDIVFGSVRPSEFNLFRRGGNNLFPLYLYPEVGQKDLYLAAGLAPGKGGRLPNFDAGFIHDIERTTRLNFEADGSSLSASGFSPPDVLAYIYAVLFSPDYRRRFDPLLKLDFPRVPLPNGKGIFRDLARLGRKLFSLHVMDTPKLDDSTAVYFGQSKPKPGRIGWSDETVWLDAAKTNSRAGYRATKPGTFGFHAVSAETWDFHVGGFQVCHKWLNDRKNRSLSDGEILHYRRVVIAIDETIRIMSKIDEVIEEHGGWQGPS